MPMTEAQTGTRGAPATRGFLSPYRVLDLTDQRGLLAGRMLGQLGADVIQIEPPTGSPARHVPPFATDAPDGANSLYWSAYASCKRGITCDIDSEEGRALFLRLLASADFVIESADPGVMQRRRLGYDALSAVSPRIIHVSITPFGSRGPKASYADSELIVWAAAGPLWPNRSGAGVPLRISVPQAYLHGAADAAAGALLALFARHRTGRGQHVDVSAQQSAALATLSTTLASAVGHENYQFPSTEFGKRKSPDLSGSGARTRCGKWPVRDGLLELHLGMGPAAGASVNKLFAWMREEGALSAEFAAWDWITLPERVERDEITDEQIERARAQVADFLARFSKNELMRVALEKGILMAPALTAEDLVHSEQLNAREFFETVQEGARPRTLPGRFASGCAHGFVPLRPAPLLGEHNEDVYCGLLGLSLADLRALRSREVI
jgi:crotonobetainyl-CoA:carnitine CoA-transferase CaiB-like acyl-CoA transferase